MSTDVCVTTGVDTGGSVVGRVGIVGRVGVVGRVGFVGRVGLVGGRVGVVGRRRVVRFSSDEQSPLSSP